MKKIFIILILNLYFSALNLYAQQEIINLGDSYSKSDSQIFYKGNVVNNADPSTFKYFSDDYYVDKENLFYKGKIIEGADVTTLEQYSTRYASRMIKDAKYIYLEGVIQKDIDSSSFVIIDDDYAKDKNHVYYRSKMIEGVDPTSFKVVSGANHANYPAIAKDKNHVYVDGKITDKKLESIDRYRRGASIK